MNASIEIFKLLLSNGPEIATIPVFVQLPRDTLSVTLLVIVFEVSTSLVFWPLWDFKEPRDTYSF